MSNHENTLAVLPRMSRGFDCCNSKPEPQIIFLFTKKLLVFQKKSNFQFFSFSMAQYFRLIDYTN